MFIYLLKLLYGNICTAILQAVLSFINKIMLQSRYTHHKFTDEETKAHRD